MNTHSDPDRRVKASPMAHQHLTVSPCPAGDFLQNDSGERLTPPEGWEFLPAGDAAVTRRVKSKGPVWVVCTEYRRRMISKGIWAPAAHILCAKQEVSAKRAQPAYARQRERELARREKQQAAYAGQFHHQVISFLNFHPRYEKEAEQLGKMVTAHAVPVGSGTVARTRRIPVEERARAAVMAWMRHHTTPYDTMKVARIKGRRREIKKALAQTSTELLNRYRQGLDQPGDCPLKRALEKRPC